MITCGNKRTTGYSSIPLRAFSVTAIAVNGSDLELPSRQVAESKEKATEKSATLNGNFKLGDKTFKVYFPNEIGGKGKWYADVDQRSYLAYVLARDFAPAKTETQGKLAAATQKAATLAAQNAALIAALKAKGATESEIDVILASL